MSDLPVQTGVDDVHSHLHGAGHSVMDLAVTFAAITISIISLFVAVAHGRTEEKLVAASSWPFLTFTTSKDGLDAGGWTISLRLQNSGVGPARVQWLRMSLDGRIVHDRADLMSRCCGAPNAAEDEQVRLGLVSQNSPVGILPARSGVDVLAWRERNGNAAIVKGLDRARYRLRAEACYCSVLDECWISDLTPTAEPHRVDRCKPIADGYTD